MASLLEDSEGLKIFQSGLPSQEQETKPRMIVQMKPQKYNWPQMVRDAMDTSFMSQVVMSEKLKVSQQSISNWLTGLRNPRVGNMPELLKLAKNAGLDIRKYEANTDLDRISNYLKDDKGREFIRLLELYGRMGGVNKKKLFGYAEKNANIQ